jgi:quinol monooxygenase YgiN
MPAEIVIVAQLWVAEDRLEEVLDLMRRDVEYTHEHEPEVRPFALHRNTEDPRHLTMIEAFPNQDVLEAHRASQFYKDLMAKLNEPGMLERRERLVLEPLGVGDAANAYVG